MNTSSPARSTGSRPRNLPAFAAFGILSLIATFSADYPSRTETNPSLAVDDMAREFVIYSSACGAKSAQSQFLPTSGKGQSELLLPPIVCINSKSAGSRHRYLEDTLVAAGWCEVQVEWISRK